MKCRTLGIRVEQPFAAIDEAAASDFLASVKVRKVMAAMCERPEPSWSLLVFPAMIVLELTVFRKWCRKVCPLGALISLMSALNIFVRPKVDHTTCLRTAKGVDCQLCKEACYEEIDLHHADQSQPLAECTKCRDCSDVCPVHAITFPFFQKKGSSDSVVPMDGVHEEA